MPNETPLAVPAPPNTRMAGLAIAAAAILSIFSVAMDQNAQGDTPLAVLQSINGLRVLHQSVHVGAIACVFALAFGFTAFAWRLGLRRPLVLAGLIAFQIGTMAMIGATLLDGFITPDLSAVFAKASPESVKTGFNLVIFVGVALTDLARLAWVFQGFAALAWSLVLLRDRGFSRRTGFAGLISGAIVMVAALASGPSMSLPVILGILVAQLAWNLAAAIFLLRDRGAVDAVRS